MEPQEHFDDDINEEERDRIRQAERTQRCQELGNLPLSHGILVITVDENKDISFSSDSLALYEVLGLMEFVKLRINSMVSHTHSENIRFSSPDDTEGSVM